MRALRVRRIPWLEIVVVLVSAAVIAALQIAENSQGAAPQDAFSSYDTGSRGYAALFDLLRDEGVSVHRWERQDVFLDAAVGTLVYAPPDTNALGVAFEASKANAAAIAAWVEAGGRLVLLEDPGAVLTTAVGFPYTYERSDTQGRAHFAPGLRKAGVSDLGSIGAPTRWKTSKTTKTLYDDGFGPAIITYRRGAGSVIGIIDPDLFTDATLGAADRARLAYALFIPPKPGGEVWFDESLHGHTILEHWWQVVPLPFAIGAGIALVVFLIALGGAAIRLGPPLVPPKRDDRSSADFIDALATLLERGNARAAAAEGAVLSTARALERSLGLPADAPEQAVVARLPDPAQREAYREMRALAERPKLDAAAFVHAVALAQRLRKDALPHGR